MDDYSFVLSDIEIEYKKYLDLITKKKYNQIKHQCEVAIQKIDALKKIIPFDNNNNLEHFKSELYSSSEAILDPIYLITKYKYNKIYINALSLLKKIVAYNLIKDTEYIKIINFLKDFFFNTQNEDIQLKILVILQHIISINLIKLNEENINNIMLICKLENIKTHIKSIECKSAIKLLINIFIKKIFDITDDINVIKFLKQLMTSIEGINQKEWSNLSLQTTAYKSARLEIICQIIEAFPYKFKQEGNMSDFIEQDMNVFIRKLFLMNQEQLIGIKLYRLCFIIFTCLNKNYNLLEEILKTLNKNISTIKWQKTLSLELISELFKKPEIILDIFITENNLYQNLLQSFINTTYNTIIFKSQKIKEKKMNNIQNNQNASSNKKQNEHTQLNLIPYKKYIINNTHIFFVENYLNVTISINIDYIFQLLTESYIALKNSYLILLEKNNININQSQQEKNQKINLTEDQEKIKQLITFNFTDFKGGLINILLYQNDISTIQAFLMIFQSFIYIFTSFDLSEPKDELLNDLCNLALPNNLNNILEMKEKNILIIRTLFNLSHCINLLQKNSWKIFVQFVQNLYFILIKNGYYIYSLKQQFDIEIIFKNILTNIKKYSLESTIIEVQKAVQEDEANKNINMNMILMNKNNNIKSKDKMSKRKSFQIRTLTLEEKENIDILSNYVNNLFTDSNDYDNETLINVIQALYEDIEKKILLYKKEIQNKRKNSDSNSQLNNKEENIFASVNNYKNNVGKLTVRNPMTKSVIGGKNLENNITENKDFNVNFQNNLIVNNLSNINFNLVKIFEISIINIQRINLIWDKIISIIKLFSSELKQKNDFSETIFKFIIDSLSYIIVHILLKYNNKNEVNENFKEKKIQINVLSPILNLLDGNYNDYFINPDLVSNALKFLLEKCGTIFNVSGWDIFFKCIDLILFNEDEEKKNLEILFKMMEEIFSEYSDKLSILNIEIISDILEKFSLQLENKNISYTSLSFFWQCADIIEQYQKKKKDIKEYELDCLNEKIEKNKENIFYINLWKKLFNKLLIINKDKRLDIKKSGINLFSQFFVAKLKTINQINNLSNSIFNEVFYIVFKNNIEEYLSQENNINLNNNNNNIQINQQNENDKNENDNINNEEIILFSLQNLGKILKSFFEENKQKENSNNEELINIIKNVSYLYQELINKKNSPEIANNILKNLYEFGSGDKIFFQNNRQIFWESMNLLINYSTEKNFAEKYCKSVKGNKVIQTICDILITCFYSKEDFEILNKDELINNNINNFIDAIPKLMESLKIMNISLINLDLYSLIQQERYIFNLIETIGIYCNKYIDVENLINFLLKNINYNKENKHSISISIQSLITIGNIFLKNKNLINNIEEEKLKNLVIYCKNQLEEIYSIKKNKIILVELFNHNIKKKDKFAWEKMIESFNDLILKATIHKIKDEKLWEEIINYNKNLYQELDKENKGENIFENDKEKEIFNCIKKSNEYIQKNIINLIMNILLPNSGNVSPKIQQQILSLFDISDNKENNGNNNKELLFTLDNMNTDNLFSICNFQGEKELLQIYNKKEEQESINKYIEIKKNISKKFMPILFANCEKEINNYLEKEKNEGDINELKEKLILILEGLKDLDSYCAELENINKENELIIDCTKNKKGHLFIMQKSFNKLILTKDENIRKKLFEIYEEISKQFE